MSATSTPHRRASSLGLPSTPSERLNTKLAPLFAEAGARSAMIADHADVKEVYVDLVRLLYSEVRASVPLLRAALRAAEQRPGDDLVAAGITSWLDTHTTEELHHDEWLLEDFEALGGDPAELLTMSGSPAIAAMVGSAYYWSMHAHPVAILGYCAALEGKPPSSAFIDTLEARTGYPPRAFMTLRHHSVIDVGHGDELFDLIDQLPLTPEQEALIGMTALQTADMAIEAADELLDRAESAMLTSGREDPATVFRAGRPRRSEQAPTSTTTCDAPQHAPVGRPGLVPT